MRIPNFKLPTKEELNAMQNEKYKESKQNKENMSYWLPKIMRSDTKHYSVLQVPETYIVQLDKETFDWLTSESFSLDEIKEFNNLLVSKLGDFCENKTLFMKTGNFSNKFQFDQTIIADRNKIGSQFLDMFYTGMLLGVPYSSEVVFREYIDDLDNRSTIYERMPLRTEFRVFYDFDDKEIVGVSNYWHPSLMEKSLSNEDKESYLLCKDNIIKEFDELKHTIVDQVHLYMNGVDELTGKWSVDIMKNDTDFWIIDMARMERSALREEMELMF